jgi:RNA recognition motif-containing protein
VEKIYTEESTIYVGNLNYKRDEVGLKKIFSKYGKVQSVKLITDQAKEQSKGIAFIKMKKPEQAKMAVKGLNGQVIDGRTLKVSLALSRTPVDVPTKEVVEEEVSSKPKVKKVKKGLNQLFDYLNSRN